MSGRRLAVSKILRKYDEQDYNLPIPKFPRILPIIEENADMTQNRSRHWVKDSGSNGPGNAGT
jgi:hypothetical protein